MLFYQNINYWIKSCQQKTEHTDCWWLKKDQIPEVNSNRGCQLTGLFYSLKWQTILVLLQMKKVRRFDLLPDVANRGKRMLYELKLFPFSKKRDPLIEQLWNLFIKRFSAAIYVEIGSGALEK